MKKLLIILSLLFSSLLTACNNDNQSNQNETSPEAQNSIIEAQTNQLEEVYTYTITSAQNGKYYAISEDETGIFFTAEFLTIPNQPINEGDKIKAIFPENSAHDSQLFQIEKIS